MTQLFYVYLAYTAALVGFISLTLWIRIKKHTINKQLQALSK
jgi:hypothetical protein